MFNITISNENGKLVTTSRNIAEVFSKRHSDVLSAIRGLECSQDFNERNFTLVDYTDSKGEHRPEYLITRDGFSLLVMGFTGKEAMAFKEAYIQRFNELEAQRATYNAISASAADLPTLLESLAKELRNKNQQIAALAPKAVAWEQVADNTKGMLITRFGKMVEAYDAAGKRLGPITLFKVLKENGVIYKDRAGFNMPYQPHVEAGRFIVRIGSRPSHTAGVKTTYQIYITPQGVEWVLDRLRYWGYRVQDLSYDLMRVEAV